MMPDELKDVRFGVVEAMFRCFKGHLGNLAPTKATLRWDAQGGLFADGSSLATTQGRIGEPPALPEEEPARVGHGFAGWRSAPVGGEPAESTVVAAAVATYYAHWQALSYVATLDDGMGGSVRVGVTFGEMPGRVEPPERKGYAFEGYFGADGALVVAPDGSWAGPWEVAGDATLTARWSLRTPLVYDEATGRYDNDSVALWLDEAADGQVYGVRLPKYAHDPGYMGAKTGANAGLVLEPSSEEVAGRNDYVGRKLFWCTRCNGGVDADGMPYVTAIEGVDGRFSATEADTWALTPVYWRRVEEAEEWIQYDYCDGPKEGFDACYGAYVPDGRMRPYILRACYMDSRGDCSSRSGELPMSRGAEGWEDRMAHTPAADLAACSSRADGLGYLTCGDQLHAAEFMRLMLGAKGLHPFAAGCTNLFGYMVATRAESNTKRVFLPSDRAVKLLPGVHCYLKRGRQTGNQVRAPLMEPMRVSSVEEADDGQCTVSFDVDEPFSVPAGLGGHFDDRREVFPFGWANGTCDGVLGTYGCPDLAHLTDGTMPFVFQSCEWGLGLGETLANVRNSEQKRDGKWYHHYLVATDCKECSQDEQELGWSEVAVIEANTDQGFVGDFSESCGLMLPQALGASATTGSCAYFDGYVPSGGPGGGWINMTKEAGWAGPSLQTIGINAALEYEYEWMGARASAIARTMLPEAEGGEA